MDIAVANDYAAIVAHFVVRGKIERLAMHIGHTAPCFFNEQAAGGVIPDVFAIVRAFGRGQAQVKGRIAAGDRAVFSLAIHA